MTSRERVRRAINFEHPDRVPIDLGAMRASGIASNVYQQLKRRMGLDTPTKILDSMQLLAEVEPRVMDHYHIDVAPVEGPLAAWCSMPPAAGIRKKLPSGIEAYLAPGTDVRVEADGAWVLCNAEGRPFARMPRGGFYFDFIRPTMASTRIDPARYQPSDTVSDEELEAFASRATDLYENTDKALLGWGASISFCGLSALLSDNITQGSLDEWLCMLMVEKDTANEMMARGVEAAIARAKLYHQAAGDKIMVWGVASDDAGTQRAGLISPDVFREMIQPHYRRFNDWVHKNTNWKTFLHSCGSVYEYIEGWIESGIDILNPVQISAANMDPRRLMDEFGGRIVFWGGGCETQQVLPLGTPDEVRRHVKANLDVFAPPEGGFVFTQVHNIQPNVPVENVEAMLTAAYEFGRRS
ncbi:MAG TPA: uroporphyrinogen decarboxylase family protein [Phycisphaerae bacterium]|nr:uroporphyrinogen decarboxylase family protein [Phycisphaerae bacterium]